MDLGHFMKHMNNYSQRLYYKYGNGKFTFEDVKQFALGFYFYHAFKINLLVTFELDQTMSKSDDNILQLYINKKNVFNNHLDTIFLHSQPIPHFNEFGYLGQKLSTENYVLLVRKTLRSHIERPFGQQCSSYSPLSDRPFNTSSHMQCYRHCLISYALKHKQINCTPLFIDNFVSQLDLISDHKKICTTNRYIPGT